MPQARLIEGEVAAGADPFSLFADWLAEAEKKEPNDPTALSLATVDQDGLPNVRMVLLKGFDERGFVFYTNLESRKARAMAENPCVSLQFPWNVLERQVIVGGRVERLSTLEATRYFLTRPRESQLAAWASAQSRPISARAVLEEKGTLDSGLIQTEVAAAAQQAARDETLGAILLECSVLPPYAAAVHQATGMRGGQAFARL